MALGEAWGLALPAGSVIGLRGDLGAGKTQLVKGVAWGLGITTPVLSPTFALVNTYNEGRLPLYHLDLYRLETLEQIVAAGLEEYLSTPGVTIIEWAERWFGDGTTVAIADAKDLSVGAAVGVKPSKGVFRWVKIEVLSELERRISYEDFGA